MGRISRVVKGQRPTLLEASKANEIIDALNKFQNFTIEKGDQDAVYLTSTGVKIFYNGGGQLDGSGINGNFTAISSDKQTAYSIEIQDGIVTNFNETPQNFLGTSGIYSFVNGIQTDESYEVAISGGQIDSVVKKPSGIQGVTGMLNFQDPTNVTRGIRVNLKNGIITRYDEIGSKFDIAPVEICKNGQTETEYLLAHNPNGVVDQGLPALNTLLDDFYTKHEIDVGWVSIAEGDKRYPIKQLVYTKAEADALFVTNANRLSYTRIEADNLFLAKKDADADFLKKVDNQQNLQALEQNLGNNLANAKNDLQNDINQNVKTLQLVDDQLQKNITENGEKIEGNEDKIADLEQAQRGHDQRISSLENASDDFYTKSEIDSIITDANQQIENIAQTMQSGKCLEQIFNSLKLTIAEMQKQNGILENILNSLQNK